MTSLTHTTKTLCFATLALRQLDAVSDFVRRAGRLFAVAPLLHPAAPRTFARDPRWGSGP